MRRFGRRLEPRGSAWRRATARSTGCRCTKATGRGTGDGKRCVERTGVLPCGQNGQRSVANGAANKRSRFILVWVNGERNWSEVQKAIPVLGLWAPEAKAGSLAGTSAPCKRLNSRESSICWVSTREHKKASVTRSSTPTSTPHRKRKTDGRARYFVTTENRSTVLFSFDNHGC